VEIKILKITLLNQNDIGVMHQLEAI